MSCNLIPAGILSANGSRACSIARGRHDEGSKKMAVADKSQTCGSRTIRYPGDCTYSCVCPGGSGPCTWTVTCGGTVFSGTGLTVSTNPGHPKVPHVTLDGDISVLSKTLQEAWKRRVIVPPNLRDQRIRKRTFRGTPEEIADALGLQLGPKIKGKKAKSPKGDSVSIKFGR